MQDSKLLKILQRLSKEELKLLRKFLHSPVYNTNEGVTQLGLYLINLAPKWPSKKLAHRYVYAQLFPKEKYKDEKKRRLMNGLLEVVKAMLIYKRGGKYSISPFLDLLSAYLELNLYDEFESLYKTLVKQQAKTTLFDRRTLLYDYLLKEYRHLAITKQNKREQEPQLQALSESMDDLYLFTKLKCLCEMLNFQSFTTTEYHFDAINEAIIIYLESNWIHASPPVAIYYHVLRCFLDQKEGGHFEQLMTLLEKHKHQFTTLELQDINVFARNYCIRQANKGKLEYLEKLFVIYKLEIETATIFDNDIISLYDYNNVVRLSTRLNEIEWLENFIFTYKDAIDPAVKTDIFHFNLARLRFVQKRFNEAKDLLLKVNQKELFLTYDVKTTLLKTYYELDDIDNDAAFNNLVKNTRRQLANDTRMADVQRENYEYFLDFIHQIFKIDSSKSDKIKQLKTNIEASTALDKPWLLEKVNELLL